MTPTALSDKEFARFQRFIHDAAGITLSSSKKALVSGRLAKRLARHALPSFTDYLDLLGSGADAAEVQTAVDLLTTNETYFFREPKHFDLLRAQALAPTRRRSKPFRVWSAACSSGEEVYSMAMVLDEALGDSPWEVMGSDISTRVLQRAATGHYPLDRTRHVSPAQLKRHCLRGIDAEEGTLLVQRSLRERVRFQQVNLNTTLPSIGRFDAIFLRNVMIYFDATTKRQVVARVLEALEPGGLFCIGHSESLSEINDSVTMVAPAAYRKP